MQIPFLVVVARLAAAGVRCHLDTLPTIILGEENAYIAAELKTPLYVGDIPEDDLDKYLEYNDTHITDKTTMAHYAVHLEALQLAASMSPDIVLIAHADIGLHLCPFWPSTPQQYIDEVSATDPDWEVLKLEWAEDEQHMLQIMDEQFEFVKGRIREHVDVYDKLCKHYGRWRGAHMLRKYSASRGHAALVYSKKGLEKAMTMRHQESGYWRCPSRSECTTDGYLREVHMGATYVAVPALFTQRIGQNAQDRPSWLTPFFLKWMLDLHAFAQWRGAGDFVRLLWDPVDSDVNQA